MKETVNAFTTFMTQHPHYGYLIAAAGFIVLFLGFLLKWKWVINPEGRSRSVFLYELFGPETMRKIMIYVTATIAIICIAAFLLSDSGSKSRDKAVQETQLFQIEQNNLYGYVNENSDTVVQCKYLFSYTNTIKTIGFVMNQDNRIICLNNKGEEVFETFNYDNGPDYPREGCFRIIGKNGLMGFADTLGNVVVEPVYKFAYSFDGGKAKVTFTGELKSDTTSNGENHYWKSDNWTYINNPLREK